jgi:hypothetical protein
MHDVGHKVHTCIYIECALVGIGTLPPNPSLSPANVPLPPEPKGGHTGHTRLRVRGWGVPIPTTGEKAQHSAYTLWRRTRRDAWTQPPSRRFYTSSTPSSPRRNSPESLVTKELSQKTQIELKFGRIRCDEEEFWRKNGILPILLNMKRCSKFLNTNCTR